MWPLARSGALMKIALIGAPGQRFCRQGDGVLWPRHHLCGSEALPVVILEVQMPPNRRFLEQDVTWCARSPISGPALSTS